ncbi:response regulator receiver protein [Ancylobacter novellus DSM 506]|uniref:Response regulator receiver protein n=1 Tax=Ancylobacter novellus (strain ATCC 8093 / DSM 506 / JCM 20403 / CCM 1077 / IAM 12100 / NBRC 12443 / NCIMB 10456) TaxID=639283 RepID=D7A042_ANCN5|nr:response regulator transcription factor [Ancylobacter novellus]ADH89303.1 response regulator receiver protein [Ancylobacter novellus DSM 506]
MGAILPDMVIKELDPRVLIVDSLALRGLGIKGLLRQWAQERGVELDFWDPTASLDPDLPAFTYRLGILSLGHMSIGDRTALGWLAHLRRTHPNTPIVVWSDLPALHEALHAIQHGVQGFVPTVTTPQLAMQALTFIMSGGTYFPPEALIETSLSEEQQPSPDISRSKPDGPNGYGGAHEDLQNGAPDAFGRGGAGPLASRRPAGRASMRVARLRVAVVSRRVFSMAIGRDLAL